MVAGGLFSVLCFVCAFIGGTVEAGRRVAVPVDLANRVRMTWCAATKGLSRRFIASGGETRKAQTSIHHGTLQLPESSREIYRPKRT